MSERERERSILPREKEKWKNKKKTKKTWDEDWKRRYWNNIGGAIKGVGNEKVKRPKNQGNRQVSQP